MTYELGEHFGQLPDVRVHYSDRSPLLNWEQQLLVNGTSPGAGYARHISLNIDEQPVLLARSVTLLDSAIPPLLTELQRTPLARILFEDEQWLRIGKPIPLQTSAARHGRACLWQDQRSMENLLVEEFFLF